MSRLEYKYLVPVRKIAELRKLLNPYVYLDKYSERNPDNQYSVRSIYFDTLRLDYYHEKLAGLKRRKKLRIRGYDKLQDDSLSFLEIKRKNGPTISKSRAPVLYQQLVNLIDSGNIEAYQHSFNVIRNGYEDARSFLYHLYKSNLQPTIKIIYEREAYFYKFYNGVRLTLDKNLRSSLSVNPESLYDEENIIHSLPKHCILEVKLFGEIPLWLQDIISILELRQEAVSKYTICLDSHGPHERHLEKSIRGRAKYNQHKHYANWEITR